jgi:hypothetical protein
MATDDYAIGANGEREGARMKRTSLGLIITSPVLRLVAA